MADDMNIPAGPRLAHAEAAIMSGDRAVAHGLIEATNVIDDVMSTVTPRDTLSWSGGWSWAAPAVNPDGTIKHRIETSWDGIRAFYTGNRGRYQVVTIGRTQLRLCSDWYGMVESNARFESVPDRTPYKQTWAAFSPMDGSQGITGEIVWGRFPQLEPGPDVTDEDRVAVYYDYLDALRTQNIDVLLSLMSDGVQGAVRDYAGNENFVSIDGAAAMRRHYEQLFGAMRIHAVDPVQFVNRGWYLFAELRWQVEFTAGPRKGRSGSLLIAEIMPLDKDGRIYGRFGFGTELLAG